MSEDVLRLVANPTNRRILEALIPEPGHPRQLAKALHLNETEVSRRLKRLERASLVSGQWERASANVRRYRLSADSVRIAFAPTGLAVTVQGANHTREEPIPAWAFDVPATPGLVRRPGIEAVLAEGPRVVFVQGLAGAGKTFVAAAAARAHREGPVYWHVLRPTDTLRRVVHRTAAFLQAAGHPNLMGLWSEGVRDAEALMQALSTGLNDARALAVFDDYHAVADPEVQDLIRHLMKECDGARLVVASRERPRFLPPGKGATVVELTGFTAEEVRDFLETKGLKPTRRDAKEALGRTGGHPLLLNLYAEWALAHGGSAPDLPEAAGDDAVVQAAERFLWDEVFHALTDGERRALEAASVLRGAFPRDALQALLPDKTAEYRLFSLERRLLLSRQGEVFVLHDLLRDFAYARARSKPKLHKRAGEHYETAGTLEARLEAMYHYLQAGEKGRVERILLRNLDLGEFDYIGEGYHALYEDILSAFREKDVTREAWTIVLDERADIALVQGKHASALRFYQDEEKRLPKKDVAARADVAWKMGIALAALGKMKPAEESLQGALALKGIPALARDRLKRALADVQAGRAPRGPAKGRNAQET